MEVIDKIKVFIVGGTGRIGSFLVKFIEENKDLSIIGIQNTKGYCNDSSYQIYNDLPKDKLRDIDIILDCSSTDCTQKNLNFINDNKIFIESKTKPLLYFAITPDLSTKFSSKTSDIIKKININFYGSNKIIIIRKDDISGLAIWFKDIMDRIEKLLKQEDRIKKVELRDRHRKEKEVCSQSMLKILEDHHFITSENKKMISRKIEDFKDIACPNIHTNEDMFYYTCEKRDGDKLELTLRSNRKYTSKQLKEGKKSDSIHYAVYYDEEDKKHYIEPDNDSKNSKFIVDGEKNAKDFLDVALREYKKIMSSFQEKEYYQ